MRILYGLSGVGLGHATRAKEVIQHLEREKHRILVLTYGEAYNFLKKDFDVYKIEGFPLHFKEGSLLITPSVYGFLESAVNNLKRNKQIRRKINKFSPEVCITDMEPFTSILSYFYNLPLISINNQYSLILSKLKIPKNHREGLKVVKLATKLTTLGADAHVVLSFSKNNLNRRRFYTVSPIIRKEILNLRPSKSDFILVYQTKLCWEFIGLLKQIPEKFIIYNYDKNFKEENITFKKIGPGFINDLKMAKAVIGTSGFSLISESLYLKKPYFAIPLKNHFEQTFNALCLKERGFGDFSKNPTRMQIMSFIKNLHNYEKKLVSYNPNPKEALEILDEILKQNWL